MEMMGREFSLEVVGANAKFLVPDYMPADPTGRYKKLFQQTDDWFLQSRNVIEVQISSKDINRSFSIVAWFPHKFAEHQSKQAGIITAKPGEIQSAQAGNPYGTRKDVRVYNGDLRTTIQIVSPEEVSASFGRHFHKYFYVGRVFFRNRHQDKRLMVYTTSMRANVLMYRKQSEETEKQRPLTDKEQAEIRKKISAVEPMVPKGLVDTCVAAAFAANLPGQGQRYDEASKIVAGIWENKKQVKEFLQAQPRFKEDELRAKCVDITRRVYELIDQELIRLSFQQDKLKHDLLKIMSVINITKKDAKITSTNKAGGANSLFSLLDQIAGKTNEQNSVTILTDIDNARKELSKAALIEAAQRKELETALASARITIVEIEKSKWLQASLSQPESPQSVDTMFSGHKIEWQKNLVDIKARIRVAVVAEGQFTPMDQVQAIRVNPANNALSFSQNANLQRMLLENGMLWQDYYRPMTFQAVLNSLIFVHDRSWETRTVKFMESAARVAGGIAAMGTVFNELTSQGYTEGVNVFSTILLPEISKQIMEDVNKSIRNLGDLSMDTVVVIPPNGAVDRYVFFPKGPIYNFVDEFNITDPGYIVRVDSSDVSAEALLIDQDTPVQAGELDSKTLVSRAINEGRASESAEILKKAALEEKLRRFDLMTLAADVENVLGSMPISDPTAVKTAERLEKERQVILMVRDFEDKHGVDKTGLIVSLMRKYNVTLYAQPPVFATLETVHLPAGFLSDLIPLPITDENTKVWNLKPSVVTNTNTKLIPSDDIKWDYPTRNDPHALRFRIASGKLTKSDEAERGTLTLQVENDAGRKATNSLEIVVHPVAIKVFLGGDEATNGVITLANKNEVKTLQLQLPVYQAMIAGEVEVSVASVDKSISLVSEKKATAMLIPEKDGPKLRAEWRLDTSLIPNSATSNAIGKAFTLTLTPGKGLTPITTDFTIKLKAP